jgi:hypothetical protein
MKTGKRRGQSGEKELLGVKSGLALLMVMGMCLALLCGALIAGCAGLAPANDEKTAIDGNTTIVVAANATEVAKFAARELKGYLKKISGVDLPIVADDKKVSGKLILVGKSRYTDELGIKSEFAPDSFIIKTAGEALILMGDDRDNIPGRGKYIPFNAATSRKGSLFAVYTFLERFFGVRWLWPGEDGEVVPRSAKPAYPVRIDISEKPDFLWRHFFFYAGKELPAEIKYKEIPLWSIRNKLGVSIGSPWSFAHSWAGYLGNGHFKKHPEYYAMVDGERHPFRVNKQGRPYAGQICTSNPDVVKLFVEKIKKKYPTNSDDIVSVSPNDGLGFCECEKCRALDHPELYGPKEGFKGEVHSDRIYGFVNRIAREIRKTHPKLKVGIFSYTVVRPVPRALKKLEDNVVISMTQTDANYRDSEYKKKNRKRLAEWISKGGAYIGRDYIDNYSFAAVTHPMTRILVEDLRYMKKNKFIGFYTEASISFATNFLNYYVLSKLMWNPNVDLNAVIDDFCEKAYGGGAEPMRRYFDLMENSFLACHTAGIHPGNIPDWYSPATIAKAYALLDQAAKLAVGEKEKARIRYCRVGLEYTDNVVALFRLYRRLNDCGLPIGLAGYTADTSKKHSRAEIVELLKSAMNLQKKVATMLDEYKSTSLLQPYPFQHQNEIKRWFKSIDEYWSLYGEDGENQKLTVLPDVWKFKTDPKNAGVKEKWFAPSFNDADWKNIRIDKQWEKQGYENYDGYAWYRLAAVAIPEKAVKGKYVLRLGAVDESCWVYVNGSLAGSAIYDAEKEPDGWKKPREFNITRFLKPGAGNLIAVRVHDAKYAGGIWQRAFLIHKTDSESAAKPGFSEKFNGNALPEQCSTHLKDAEFKVADGALNVTVSKAFPSGFSMTIHKVKLAPNTRYVATISYSLKNVEENSAQKKRWLKRPNLPSVRLIFLDEKNKSCVPVKKYVWFGAKFAENTPKTMTARRIFKTPAATASANITIYLQAKGEYRIEEITIDAL